MDDARRSQRLQITRVLARAWRAFRTTWLPMLVVTALLGVVPQVAYVLAPDDLRPQLGLPAADAAPPAEPAPPERVGGRHAGRLSPFEVFTGPPNLTPGVLPFVVFWIGGSALTVALTSLTLSGKPWTWRGL